MTDTYNDGDDSGFDGFASWSVPASVPSRDATATAWHCMTHGGVRKDLCCDDAIPFTPADFHFAIGGALNPTTPAAPLASLGERADVRRVVLPSDAVQDVRLTWQRMEGQSASAQAGFAVPMIPALCDTADALRAELAALRSSLQEARADSERWRYLRQFLTVERWELAPASQLGAFTFKVPSIIGRSDATVEEIIDAARAALPVEETPTSEETKT